jgi:hypothetical protein
MKTATVRTLVVPVLTLALAGVTAPAASAAPPVAATASAAQASSSLTTASPKSSTVEDGVTRSGARRMRTTATWFPAEGRVVATTRTWNSVKMTGFTGGVQVVFLDREGHVLGFTGVRTFGVDGTWVGRATRTDVWQEPVPNAPAGAVAIRVVHTHAGKNRLVDIVRKAKELAQEVDDLVKTLHGLKPAS